jgi:hypothetical protein
MNADKRARSSSQLEAMQCALLRSRRCGYRAAALLTSFVSTSTFFPSAQPT